MKYIVHTDGGARGNPGIAGVGVVIDDDHGNAIARVSRYLGTTTNNIAEYSALILAFETLLSLVPESERTETIIDAILDSELVVKQLNGIYRIKNAELQKLYLKLLPLIRSFHTVTFTHVLREKNKEADALANEAMDSAGSG